LPLSFSTREVGAVTVVCCSGRIVTGETEALLSHFRELLLDRSDILLHLGEVIFIDSSGLGLLVRLLTSTRSAGGDLKLCQVPENVRKVLKLTNISSLFETLETEEEGILAFYRRQKAPSRPAPSGITVLCVDQSANVLAYLREVLTRSGYNVLTSNNLRDSLILLRATRPGLAILGPNLTAAPGTEQAFRTASAACPVLELGDDFSRLEASEATSALLEKIRAILSPVSPRPPA
jgi:anti-sigma B factor antagonist